MILLGQTMSFTIEDKQSTPLKRGNFAGDFNA